MDGVIRRGCCAIELTLQVLVHPLAVLHDRLLPLVDDSLAHVFLLELINEQGFVFFLLLFAPLQVHLLQLLLPLVNLLLCDRHFKVFHLAVGHLSTAFSLLPPLLQHIILLLSLLLIVFLSSLDDFLLLSLLLHIVV